MPRKQSSPQRQKYVCEVVVETMRPVTKKAMREWIENAMSRVTSEEAGQVGTLITKVRVRAIDFD